MIREKIITTRRIAENFICIDDRKRYNFLPWQRFYLFGRVKRGQGQREKEFHYELPLWLTAKIILLPIDNYFIRESFEFFGSLEKKFLPYETRAKYPRNFIPNILPSKQKIFQLRGRFARKTLRSPTNWIENRPDHMYTYVPGTGVFLTNHRVKSHLSNVFPPRTYEFFSRCVNFPRNCPPWRRRRINL